MSIRDDPFAKSTGPLLFNDLCSGTAGELAGCDLWQLARLTQDLFCVADKRGYLLRVNPAWARVLGRPLDELTSRPLLELVHPEDLRASRRALRRLARGGGLRLFTNRLVHADGGHVWLSWNAVADRDQGLVYAVARDVGELKQEQSRRLDAQVRIESARNLLESIHRLQRMAITDCEPGAVFDALLEKVLELTSSRLGFVAELAERDGRRALAVRALREGGERGGGELELVQLDSLLGPAVLEGRVVNVPDVTAEQAGLPLTGRLASVRSLLALPLSDDEGVVGVLGLADREAGFDDGLAGTLDPLLSTAARLVRSYQARRARELALENLRLSEQRWQRSIELAAYPMLLWGSDRRITYSNRAAQDLLGLRRRELVGRSIDDLIVDRDLDHAQTLDRKHQDGWGHRITHVRAADGAELPVELQAVDLGDGTCQAVLLDMREWVAIEARLKSASQRDNLTGLLNRAAIEEHAEVEIQRARRRASPVSLLLIDVDHFKAVNDRHGHLVGDAALKRVAEIIRDNVRPYDWVGRWGGEEILVVLPETREDQAVTVGERIRCAVASAPLECRIAQPVSLTVSVGVAGATIGYVPSLRKFFERIDRSMYLAKHQGRDRVVVYQDTTLFQRFPGLPPKATKDAPADASGTAGEAT